MHVGRGQTPYRSVERVEGMLTDKRGDFAADSPGQAIFVNHQHLSGLARRGENRLAVERQQRSQIENFDRKTVFLVDDSRGVETLMDRAAVGDNREVAPLLSD